ncbi:unnamed protein product [Arctia plantaginis]|uniref:Uncharacterized protein n=1 Tax=Arctia plantaginis TaxID=874455 RepID=A0A8S0Z840_ARCPL|nr:unnamed protein product [Arctia plantaginis]
MDATIGFYMASLLCPGSILFSIYLDDIPRDDIYLRVFAATAAKLLFSYSETPRWTSVTEGSVRTVETAIVRCGIAAAYWSPYRDVRLALVSLSLQ